MSPALCSLMARPSPWLSGGPWAVAGGMAQLPEPPGARLPVAPGNPAESEGALEWGTAAQRRSQRVPTSVHRTEAVPPRAWHHVNAAAPPPPPPPDWLLVLGKELRFSSAGYLLIRRQRGTELVLSSVSRVSLRLQKDSIHRRQRVEVNAEFLHPLSWLPCMDTKATKGYQLAQR